MTSAPGHRATNAEIDHPLTAGDRIAMDAMRVAMAPGKGHVERASFDDVMELVPDAPGVTYETAVVGGVPGVWCHVTNAMPDTVMLYLHGGAYIAGTAHAYRHFVGHLAARAEVTAFIPDYRLAPENPFPAAVDDIQSAYRGLVREGARSIAIFGDSAGGGLALILLALACAEARASDGVAPCAGAVMSPWTDLAFTGASLTERADADPVLTRDALVAAATQYLKEHSARDPLASPLYVDFAALPPLQLHVGSDEILLDDARRVFERARAAHVDATLHIWHGMPHVFPSNVGKLAAADQALEIMARFTRDYAKRSV